jgi:hypothetical protein
MEGGQAQRIILVTAGFLTQGAPPPPHAPVPAIPPFTPPPQADSMEQADQRIDELAASGRLDPALLLTMARAYAGVKETDITREEVGWGGGGRGACELARLRARLRVRVPTCGWVFACAVF